MSTPAARPWPWVSIIIPAYNTAAYIRETLQSVFSQDYPHCEVVVVNDGSPDTPQLEQALKPFASRIVYLKQPNRGVASARNAGIRASKGELIAFLDSDDLHEPCFLRVQVSYLLSHPDVAVVYGDGIIFGAGHPEIRISQVSPSQGEVTFASLVNETCCVPTSGTLSRRDALVAVGLFDESLRWGEDFDLWLRLTRAGYRIAYHREIVFRYRRHPQNISQRPDVLPRHAALVMQKFLASGDLSPEEARLALRAKRRFEAAVLLAEGMAAFEEHNFRLAVQKLTQANQTLRSPRLMVMRALLHSCPQALWHLRRLWRKTREELTFK